MNNVLFNLISEKILSQSKMMKSKSDKNLKKKEKVNLVIDDKTDQNEVSYPPEEFDLQFNHTNENNKKTQDITSFKPTPLPTNESSIYNSELFDFKDSFKSLGVKYILTIITIFHFSKGL